MKPVAIIGADRRHQSAVPQTSKSAVPQVSKPAGSSAAEPAWKPAIQQVWKPAAHNRGGFALWFPSIAHSWQDFPSRLSE
jgi:cell division septation protein DedD